jgi:hypothetical protein
MGVCHELFVYWFFNFFVGGGLGPGEWSHLGGGYLYICMETCFNSYMLTCISAFVTQSGIVCLVTCIHANLLIWMYVS